MIKMDKLLAAIIGIAVILIGAFAITLQFAHKLENQNLAIVQSMTGDVSVRRIPGWWIQVSPTIWEYPKAGIYRLNAKDKDSLEIQFKNKSTATLNVNIGYRIDNATDDTLIALHQQVEGNDEKVWSMLLTALNTMAQSVTTKYDPSDVIGGDKFENMIKEMYASIVHNAELKNHGIDVNYFAVDGRPIPDKETKAQFDKQREADLARRLAEAEKLKLEAEKMKVQSEYAKKMTEQEGIAKAQMAKEVQDAERQKKLAEIEAQKRVEVEKLAKEQLLVQKNKEKEAAEVEANKQFAIAEIQKKTEAEQLAIIEIQAKQKVATANARAKELELSKALSETDKAKIDLELGKERVKWESIGKALATMKLPQIVNIGGNGGQTQNSLDTLIQTMTLEKLNNSQAVPKSK